VIVIDTNILAYGVLTQGDPDLRRQAEALLQRADRILLPALWRHEFLSVLSKYAKKELISMDDAIAAWFHTVALAQDSEAPVDMPRALQLSQELGVSAYDAQYLALAEDANTVLITEDRRLRAAVGPRAKSMEEYLAA
jgi:predicted nucleic acid-binding protein